MPSAPCWKSSFTIRLANRFVHDTAGKGHARTFQRKSCGESKRFHLSSPSSGAATTSIECNSRNPVWQLPWLVVFGIFKRIASRCIHAPDVGVFNIDRCVASEIQGTQTGTQMSVPCKRGVCPFLQNMESC